MLGTTLTMPHVDTDSFGDALRRYRKLAGLTQIALAELVEQEINESVSDRSVSQWERNEIMPPRHKVEALEKVLKVEGFHLLDLAGYLVSPDEDRVTLLESDVQILRDEVAEVRALLTRIAEIVLQEG